MCPVCVWYLCSSLQSPASDPQRLVNPICFQTEVGAAVDITINLTSVYGQSTIEPHPYPLSCSPVKLWPWGVHRQGSISSMVGVWCFQPTFLPGLVETKCDLGDFYCNWKKWDKLIGGMGMQDEKGGWGWNFSFQTVQMAGPSVVS